MTTEVFLSVGRACSQEQEDFIAAVERGLLERGLKPCSLGRTEWSSVQPLRAVRERMQTCYGTAVIAFERVHIESGIDHRGVDRYEVLNDERLPTVWNQIEASMAYSVGHPLLVICEAGLRIEGVLENRYDWAVLTLPVQQSSLEGAEIDSLLDDWAARVKAYRIEREGSASGTSDLAELSIVELVGGLRPGQLWTALSALATIAVVAFTLGSLLG